MHGQRAQLVCRELGEAGRTPPRPTIESISLYSDFHLVAENQLITIAPANAVATYTSLQLIKSLPFAWPFELSLVNLVRLYHAVSPALEAMLDACVEICAQGSSRLDWFSLHDRHLAAPAMCPDGASCVRWALWRRHFDR